ncbi:MAG: dihydrodipicolinate synthase family protein [Eubacteriales bacterium]
MFKMHGVVPPMVTPFDKEGNVDKEALKKLVRYLAKEVDGVFITGSYGSGALMTLEERKEVAEIVIEEIAGEIDVIVMVGTTTNRESVELTKHAKKVGANAVAAVGPYYFSHNAQDVMNFYNDLITCEDIPVYLYNNPKFQGYEIGLETIKKLKDMGLAGIKDATFDILTHATYQRVLKDDHFDVALGTEAMFASARVLGCEAFIPGLANAFPEINRLMFKQGMDNDFEAMRDIQFKINRLRDVMYLAKSTQLAIYAMLEIRGIVTCYPRKPFIQATQQEKEAIRKELGELNML